MQNTAGPSQFSKDTYTQDQEARPSITWVIQRIIPFDNQIIRRLPFVPPRLHAVFVVSLFLRRATRRLCNSHCAFLSQSCARLCSLLVLFFFSLRAIFVLTRAWLGQAYRRMRDGVLLMRLRCPKMWKSPVSDRLKLPIFRGAPSCRPLRWEHHYRL